MPPWRHKLFPHRRFPLTDFFGRCYKCNCVKPTTLSGKALKNRLPENSYRVLKHGTYAADALPAFHTQITTAKKHNASNVAAILAVPTLKRATGVSYTASPFNHSRLYRWSAHAPTGESYTKPSTDTVVRYTAYLRKCLKKLVFLWLNCTKLSSKTHKTGAVVLLVRSGGGI